MVMVTLPFAVLLIVTTWALWVRRDSWRSRWDAPMTASIAFQTIGAAFDTPWPRFQIAISQLAGGPHVATLVADLSYLTAAVLAIIAVYSRLLPDGRTTEVFNRRVLQSIAVVAATMIFAFVMSSAARTGSPLAHLYFIPRDGWLTLYWVVYCLALQVMVLVIIRGQSKLNPQTYSRLYRLAFFIVLPASMLQFIGLFDSSYLCIDPGSGLTSLRLDDPACLGVAVCWMLGYLATILMSLAAGWSWQGRLKNANPPTKSPQFH